MTNAPTYDWHMTNLQNYVNLSVKDVENAKLGPVTLPAFGSGLLGMPGDFTPPSRFVRAAIYNQSAAPNATAEDAVFSAFHIPKGSVQNSAIGGTVEEITEWTSVADLKNLRWYFRTFTDQSRTHPTCSSPVRTFYGAGKALVPYVPGRERTDLVNTKRQGAIPAADATAQTGNWRPGCGPHRKEKRQNHYHPSEMLPRHRGQQGGAGSDQRSRLLRW